MSLLSIVTITFNNFDELLHTVESVKDLKCCEHLIINGGKCQKTLEFLQSFSGTSISEPDQGISDAFNKGIKLSQGSAVMLLNSGDILLDQTYPEKALHILKEHPEVDFVHANELYDDAMIGEFVMRPLRKQNNLYPNIGKECPIVIRQW
jgi:glycosyltransferase involved in cell wall biosynthesis